MDIGYTNISSGLQSVSGNTTTEQASPAGRVQPNGDNVNPSAGKMFQGEILDIKGTQVSIGLENGQLLTANMEADVSLSVGQKVMFEIKSNSGSQIEIRPVIDSNNPNPVLQKALQAANIPLTDRNLLMVDTMLKEGLSIDKQSLTNMLRQLNMNPGADVATVINLNKWGISATKENIGQLENYKNYEHRIVKDLNNLSGNIAQLLSQTAGEDKKIAIALNNSLVDILNKNIDSKSFHNNQGNNLSLQNGNNLQIDAPEQIQHGEQNQGRAGIEQMGIKERGFIQNTVSTLPEGIDPEVLLPQEDMVAKAGSTIKNSLKYQMQGNVASPLNIEQNVEDPVDSLTKTTNKLEQGNPSMLEPDSLFEKNSTSGKPTLQQFDLGMIGERQGKSEEVKGNGDQQLLGVLNNSERSNLADMLKTMGAETTHLEQIKEGTIGNKELLSLVKDLLHNPDALKASDVLFQSKEYQEVLKKTLLQQWLVEPESLKEPDKMATLYKEMAEQVKHLTNVMESIGKENSAAFKDVTNIRSNLSFMEQINQNYTYMQIPVQFTNEEAHSDLYVYTNKKSLANKDGKISVLLHLDMEVLGVTDVYIQMSGNHVTADFSLGKDDSIQLVSNNLEELVQRLKEKGYEASAKVEVLKKDQDFVDDFLEKDKIVTSLKRYAFDVRT